MKMTGGGGASSHACSARRQGITVHNGSSSSSGGGGYDGSSGHHLQQQRRRQGPRRQTGSSAASVAGSQLSSNAAHSGDAYGSKALAAVPPRAAAPWPAAPGCRDLREDLCGSLLFGSMEDISLAVRLDLGTKASARPQGRNAARFLRRA
ncbi:hypothetical protein JKP88DRAFT_282472 [Tribonema minus]|uniref:Uncharacterized protein n=1 Tax=Tribonema minus TaxID=303371 RepID=A0A835YUM5_9STRA|nr:hypothetical protein JKP88DRAFT_282472 [Tribonema minus]